MTEPTVPNPADPYRPAAPPPPPAAPYPPAGTPYPTSVTPYPTSASPYTPYPSSVMPYPASAAPYGLVPPPPPRRSPWTIVFGIAAAVLLLASGGAGALYVLERNEASDQAAQVEDLRDQLEEAQANLALAERDLTDLQADTKACNDAVEELFDFVPSSSTPDNISREDQIAITNLTLAMFRACGAL